MARQDHTRTADPPRAVTAPLTVKLHVADPSLPRAELAALAKEAHETICPYSHATRGNVDVQIDVKGG